MTIKIYDCADDAVSVEIPANSADEIEEIFVNVLSGDETGWVALKNGKKIHFDASNCRLYGFDDGQYFVNGDDIKEWLDFNAEPELTHAYDRLEKFGGGVIYDS